MSETPTRPALPSRPGEITAYPLHAEWPRLVQANREAVAKWSFSVAGMPVAQYRREVRKELVETAAVFSEKLGVEVRATGDADAPVVMSGHQPDLYHPGVWVKVFALDRLAQDIGATAIDVMVDTDAFDSVSMTAPCMVPEVMRCTQHLALGGTASSFAFAPVPDAGQVSEFCETTQKMLSTLPMKAVQDRFAEFARHLAAARADASNLSELVTIARRRFEAVAGTGYLELPLSAAVQGRGFVAFAADLALNAERFADAYNGQLAQYRTLTKARSAAQPFPDLGRDDDRFELPLWHLTPQGRTSVWAQTGADSIRLISADRVLVELPVDPGPAVERLVDSKLLLAPKALALTLFARMFACDFFVHGVGGGRYDQVTDGVIRHFYGVEPPAFAVVSLTMHLPVGEAIVTADQVAGAKERLHRLEHNPDTLLGEIEFDDPATAEAAGSLSAEKRQLVAQIALPDADKKALGLRIKEVNRELAALLAPVKSTLEAELKALEKGLVVSEVLTDRTYPFCLWDPVEIAQKIG